MNFQVTKMEIPSIPEFNFEELKAELSSKVEKYENLIYSDAEIAQAKKDRADLNKLKKAINDERIKREKEYMQPFNEFKSQVNEIIGIIEKPINVIDKQVKEYEQKEEEKKSQEIAELFNNNNPYEWLELNQIMRGKWLNKSESLKAVEEDMKLTFDMINSDISIIKALRHADEAMEVYKKTLSRTQAAEIDITLTKSQEKQATTQEVTTQEVATQIEAREWMTLEICINSEDYDAFSLWAEKRKIEWRMK